MLYRSGHAQIPVLLTKFSNFKKLQLELYLVLPIMHIPNLCLKVLKSYHCPTLFCSLSFNLCKNSRKIFFLSRSVKPGYAIMYIRNIGENEIQLRNHDQLQCFHSNFAKLDLFPLFNYPKIWQSFPDEQIKIIRKPTIFDTHLKNSS